MSNDSLFCTPAVIQAREMFSRALRAENLGITEHEVKKLSEAMVIRFVKALRRNKDVNHTGPVTLKKEAQKILAHVIKRVKEKRNKKPSNSTHIAFAVPNTKKTVNVFHKCKKKVSAPIFPKFPRVDVKYFINQGTEWKPKALNGANLLVQIKKK